MMDQQLEWSHDFSFLSILIRTITSSEQIDNILIQIGSKSTDK